MERKIIYTKDNSVTLYVPELNEHYHSIHGAVNESLHVFIKMGLHEKLHLPQINILEIGFGTGLNVLLTFKEAKERNLKVNFTTIEAYPIDIDLVAELNYPEIIDPELKDTFFDMHQCEWENLVTISNDFILKKVRSTIQDLQPDKLLNEKFDIIYFDAFAPNKQPEMWTEEVFTKMYELMNDNGSLVTYCAQGAARRAMIASGLKVDKLPGPPFKREMLRGKRI